MGVRMVVSAVVAAPKMQWLLALLLLMCAAFPMVLGLHETDTITSAGSNTRTGHQPNHNMDPNVAKSANFDLIWRTKGKSNYKGFAEQFYAQPLIYTPPGERQSVYAVSQHNYVYRFDAVTGELLNYRQLHIPFLVADLHGCNDISDCIGSTATGVIDPDRDSWYVTTKTYVDQNNQSPQGLANGRYYIHALDTITLGEKQGFPIPLEGVVGENAPWRVFESGKHHQRPAMMQMGDYVYAGFASHCVQYNFSGWIIGWHAGSGELVSRFATEGGQGEGIGGGIWMSGGGLSSDNPGRLFFASGNGYANQLRDEPVPGRQPPTALEQAVVNMAVHENGSVSATDFFAPWEKPTLDSMDKDLGTSGFVLLEPGVFSTPKVPRIGCVAGKTGKVYFLNLDDLGGYQMGPNRKDAALQVTTLPGAVFASAGTYPFEGGYVYITPVGYPTYAFKFGQTADGNPVFTEVGRTSESAAGRQGVGHSTVTTMDGQPGTGILWIVDVEGVTLRAYGTVPVDGVLPTYRLLNSDSQSKFSRPSFGNGKVYVTSSTGYVSAFGSPVNMPLNCSSPIEAGSVSIGNSSVVDVTCVALAPVRVDSVDLDSAAHFSVLGLPTLPRTMAIGDTVSFKSNFAPKAVGPLSTNINIRSANLAAQKFASNTPVVIRGKAVSQKAVLKIQPNALSFGELITGSEPASLSFVINNPGLSPLEITSYKWSFNSSSGPFFTPNSTVTVGVYTFTNLPGVGDTAVPAESERLVTVEFNPPSDGKWQLFLAIGTNGGTVTVGIFGASGGAAKARLEWQLSNGTWIEYSNASFVFDNGAFRGQQQFRKMRLTNIGGTVLTTTISKPPISGPLAATNPLGSIAEGSQLAPGRSEEATIICSPPRGQLNTDPELLTAVWTLNNNDPSFGKHAIIFECTAKSRQVWETDENGQAYRRYIGCYQDGDPVRRMDIIGHSTDNNTNLACMETCAKKVSGPWPFVATEYHRECWCGSRLPPKKVPDSHCTLLCSGDYNEYCGGAGLLMSLFYDRRLWTPNNTTTTTSANPSAAPTPSPWKYVGCASEGTNGRALTGGAKPSPEMTPKLCQDHCKSLDFPLAGLEYSQECYCGTTLANGATLGSNDCNMACAGDGSQICGGPGALSLYEYELVAVSLSGSSSTTISATPTAHPSYRYLGCATEGSGGRALTGGFLFSDTMTRQKCHDHCTSLSLKYSGLEYSKECFCGSSLANGAALGSPNCNMPCAGKPDEICGGPSALSLFEHVLAPPPGPGSSLAISSPAVSSSAPPSAAPTEVPPSVPEEPTTASATEMVSSTEVVFSVSAHVSPTTPPLTEVVSSTSADVASSESIPSSVESVSPADGASSTEVIFPSSANVIMATPSTVHTSPLTTDLSSGPESTSMQTPSITKVSTLSDEPPVSLTEAVSWSTEDTLPAPSTTSSDNAVAPVISSSSSVDYAYLGCAREGIGGRALPPHSFSSAVLTPSLCQERCSNLSLPLSGLGYSRECHCGIALSVYNWTSWESESELAGWADPGCWSEAVGERALKGDVKAMRNMTMGMCVGYCDLKGCEYAGGEYAQECYCSDSLALTSRQLAREECGMLCAGGGGACGGGSRLSVYRKGE